MARFALHLRHRVLALTLVVATHAVGAQSASRTRSLLPDSGAFFVRKELQLLDLGVTIPLTEDPDCQHERSGQRGGTLSFRRVGSVTRWTAVDTLVRCDATDRVLPVGTRRDSGYVTLAVNNRRVQLNAGDRSPIRILVAELRWLGTRRDSLVIFGIDSLRRDLYVAAPPPKERPLE